MRLRRLTRRVGINRLIGKLFVGRTYEARLASTMTAAIKPGDCVWDVGANVGFYTVQFSGLVGPKGHVYAFEPDRSNVARLRQAVLERDNITVLATALSDQTGDAFLARGSDALGATSHIVAAPHPDISEIAQVHITTGDFLVAHGTSVCQTD